MCEKRVGVFIQLHITTCTFFLGCCALHVVTVRGGLRLSNDQSQVVEGGVRVRYLSITLEICVSFYDVAQNSEYQDQIVPPCGWIR